MKFNDGCVMGFNNAVDYESCRDPFYYCECGYATDAIEPPPKPPNIEYNPASTPQSCPICKSTDSFRSNVENCYICNNCNAAWA